MNGHPERTAGSGFPSKPTPALTAEPVAKCGGPRSTSRNECRFEGIRTGVQSLTRDPASMSSGEARHATSVEVR